jgi:tRNA threonylcarbamoyl adenosine modification protein YeaZ
MSADALDSVGEREAMAKGGSLLAVALEGSARPASLSATRGGRTLSAVLSDTREHASDLVPELTALLAALGARPRELGLVVVGLGPGSYTGLRVAAATALGLALGSGAALVGVPSFEALAFGALAVGEEADVLVDARGGHLYHARYRRRADGVDVLAAPSALTPDAARASLHAPIWLADEAALAAAEVPAPGPDVEVRGDRRAHAADLLCLGLARHSAIGPTPIAALAPLYLRSFTPHVRAR